MFTVDAGKASGSTATVAVARHAGASRMTNMTARDGILGTPSGALV